jgi:hypothetical protein
MIRATLAVLACTVFIPTARAAEPDETRVPLTITGGHDTDPRDRGRPVVLIAAALKVPDQVFRDTFSHVRPAPAGQQPDPEQVRNNKAALMDGLGKYGVNNERLDEVSNYYRYRPNNRGDIWRHKDAAGYAVVKDGKVTEVVITEPGAGYTSAPTVTVDGMKDVKLKVTVAYGTELEKNGSLNEIKLAPGGAK